ncbi:CYSTEINE-RICH RECEPTOR-LIKE PROTEIN KINASE 25 [Salix purpurea]|uniref:CYSTEINE-RICH RECEPTOR-LIKE PROTEIN KINASE 25 n=1 Tax=Salix purpurea TaxID=77065 RepID=A0A9Q0WM89_SALPP|nr:CYSTEINE-RICH RECEPTOR-LIKE PROTEIN KINASE 25 [Salix purpurea]
MDSTTSLLERILMKSMACFFAAAMLATVFAETVSTSQPKTCSEKFPNETVATIWYDECELRYSNRNFFSAEYDSPIFLSNRYYVTVEPERFNQLVAITLSKYLLGLHLLLQVIRSLQFNRDNLQILRTLVQCTPDLSTPDCRRCLAGAISKLGNCCDGKQGGIVIFARCNIRYELYEFYNATAAAEAVPAPPPVALSPPPASGSETRRKGKVDNALFNLSTSCIHIQFILTLLFRNS